MGGDQTLPVSLSPAWEAPAEPSVRMIVEAGTDYTQAAGSVAYTEGKMELKRDLEQACQPHCSQDRHLPFVSPFCATAPGTI